MPYPFLQHILGDTVIDGQLQVDGGDLQIPHHPVAQHIELLLIVLRQFLNRLLLKRVADIDAALVEPLVVVLRQLHLLLQRILARKLPGTTHRLQ